MIPGDTPSTLARVTAAGAAAALVPLWIHLGTSGGGLPGADTPLPDSAVPPVLLGVAIFAGLAVVALVAAFRDAPVVVMLCGVISLVPVGLYTLVLPWPHRGVGVLDLVLVVSGAVLLRRSARRGGRTGFLDEEEGATRTGGSGQ